MSEAETDPIPGLLPPHPRVLSANQLVSYNLMRARRAAGWSQHDTAGLLEQLTGRSWSNASVSAAERAWQGGRPRRFDAGELLAFCMIFDEPIAYFFLPPGPEEYAASHIGTREFPEGKPDFAFNNDVLSCVPTAAYLQNVALTKPTPSFSKRVTALFKHWLGAAYYQARSWTEHEQAAQEEDVDWAEVQEHADQRALEQAEEVDRMLTPEQRDAFLKKNAADLAQGVARHLFHMGLIATDEGRKVAKKNDPEEPPPF